MVSMLVMLSYPCVLGVVNACSGRVLGSLLDIRCCPLDIELNGVNKVSLREGERERQ